MDGDMSRFIHRVSDRGRHLIKSNVGQYDVDFDAGPRSGLHHTAPDQLAEIFFVQRHVFDHVSSPAITADG
jgi:hypothetical protein